MSKLQRDEFGFVIEKDSFSDLTYDIVCRGAFRLVGGYSVFPAESKRDLTFDEAIDFARDYLKRFEDELYHVVIRGWRKHEDGHVSLENRIEWRVKTDKPHWDDEIPAKDPFDNGYDWTRQLQEDMAFHMPEGKWTGGKYMREV